MADTEKNPKVEIDFDYQHKLLNLREKELANKEKELDKEKISPLMIGVIVAIIGLFSNALVSYLNGINKLEEAKISLQNQLILNAVESDSIVQNKNNLQFLLDAGLIPLYEVNIKEIIDNEGITPAFHSTKKYFKIEKLMSGIATTEKYIELLKEGNKKIVDKYEKS